MKYFFNRHIVKIEPVCVGMFVVLLAVAGAAAALATPISRALGSMSGTSGSVAASASPSWKVAALRTLFNFGGPNTLSGNSPTGLARDRSGTLFIASSLGGSNDCGGYGPCGSVFSLLNSGGNYHLGWGYSFEPNGSQGLQSDGFIPISPPVMGAAGVLYGTTEGGGAGWTPPINGAPAIIGGVIYKLTPTLNNAYSETVLYSFRGGTDGLQPTGRLVAEWSGNLYGMTLGGSCGTVFAASTSRSTLGTLHQFRGAPYDGCGPSGGLAASSSALFGVTAYGGSGRCSGGCGTVFEIRRYLRETILFNFGREPNGFGPSPVDLIADSGGDLYGTTSVGGDAKCQCGFVYKLTPTRAGYVFSVLHRFTGGPADGEYPGFLLFGPPGVIYGTASGGLHGNGTVFKLSAGKTGYTESILYSFSGKSDGGAPGSLIADDAGGIDGVTWAGGTYGYGTVFKLTP